MTIGERIKQRRQEIGLSVDEVAKKLGKNRATIYRYESNDIENMPTSVIEPIAKVLYTTPAYLMGWKDVVSQVETLDPEIVDRLNKLNTEGQTKVKSYMDDLITSGKYSVKTGIKLDLPPKPEDDEKIIIPIAARSGHKAYIKGRKSEIEEDIAKLPRSKEKDL